MAALKKLDASGRLNPREYKMNKSPINRIIFIKHDRSSQTGFTLVEVLIAMIILVVAVVGWMGAQQSSVLNRGQSRTMTVATELVQSKIEDLSVSPTAGTGTDSYSVGGFDYNLEWKTTSHLGLKAGEDNLAYVKPLYVLEVEGKWQYRGAKIIKAERVVMDEG